MKKTLFIVIVTFFSCKPSLQVTEKYGGFNRKPKKVEIQKYRMDYSDSIPIEKKAYKIVDFYNSKGVNTKTFMYKSDGSPSTGGVYYTYDKSGNLTRYIMNNIDSTINIEINYKFDKFGNEIEMIWTQGNNKTIKTRTYDRENKTVQIIGKKGDGSFKENAIQKYNDKWNKIELISYDSEGNLVYQGQDLTVTADVAKAYELEVIATNDGFKDYTNVNVHIKPSVIEGIAPNPASNNITVNYKINEASSAYLMVVGYYGGNTSNNYILDINQNSIYIDISSYQLGYYTVALVCDGIIVDAKTLIKE